MNPALVAVAIVGIGGAVLAVVARDVRATILGVLIVLLAAPLVSEPWPGLMAILARTTAALLAARFLVIAGRGHLETSGTRIGWPAEVLVAAAAAVVGFGSHGLGATALGSAEAHAFGFALIAVGVPAIGAGRDVLRLGLGALLLLIGASLVRSGLNPPPGDGEHLVAALLTIGLGGAIAVVVAAARAGGGLDAIDRGVLGRPARPSDAHRPTAGEGGRVADATGAVRAAGRSPARPGRRGGRPPP